MPTLIVLCGLPFSGKSVLGERLAEATGATLVSYDTLWREVKGATGQSLGYEDLSALAEARLHAALLRCEWAIYDTLNPTRAGRDHLRLLAANCAAESVIVWLNTPRQEIDARRAQNRLTPTRHDVPSDRLHASIAQFEEPSPDEGAREFRPDTDLAALLTTCRA